MARRGITALPGVVHHHQHAVAHGLLERRAVEDDVRRLAAEFERHLLTVSAAALSTRMPARVEPVKETMSMRDAEDKRRRPRSAVAVHQVEDPGRYACCAGSTP